MEKSLYNGGNAPQNLNMAAFRAKLDEYGQVAKGCRFAVRITPQGSNNLLSNLSYSNKIQDLLYVIDSIEFPGRGFSGATTRYYGPEFVTPNQVLYGPANISFICRTASLERQLFDDWLDIINPVTTFNYNYPKQYYCSIEIFQFAEYTNQTSYAYPIYSWKLVNAWPTAITAQQVTWQDQDILRLGISFAYKFWLRPGDTERIASKVS